MDKETGRNRIKFKLKTDKSLCVKWQYEDDPINDI